eukprot:CAMPEP_0181290880 /NCGR_PEP_ID=MMETSP1101-20121128/1659_1 /TAXON_ID=46948 /ORGANISM="Rhodomonas abbreviata, Strain Caron Lab Isolate" /LENGTH=332 /DNA_ID=CAMNT_0023395213 /DNA_START=41 /DNA_END=1039 /DNA_ORIENTATION=+
MGLVKVLKNKAYYKRFQVKKRRRRQGKTDYKQRTALVKQAKNKYAMPKYRLVVRKTNARIICQIIYSTMTGDKVMCQADSFELPRYGLKVGLKNFPAAYCVGLLVGRRCLQKLGMDEMYTGVGNDEEDEITGEIMETEWNKRKYFVDELDEDRRPFKCFLDIGLAYTVLGAKVFAALKGASDAGLDIPHNFKKFPGYEAGEDGEADSYDPEELRDVIFGARIAEYMGVLKEEDEQTGGDEYSKRFSQYIKHGVDPDDYEDLLKATHKAIRADPSPKYAEPASTRRAQYKKGSSKKQPKKTREEKLASIKLKLAKIEAMREAEESEDESEDSE